MRGPRLVVVGLLVALALVAAAGRWAARQAPVTASAPAIAIPPVALTERSGAQVTDQALRGKVWIAGFVFTRCTTICPRLAAVMSGLQEPLRALPGGEDARLVAFSVDPEHDTPAVFAEWAKRFQADPARWLFLTGDRTAIWTLAEQGFKLPVQQEAGTPGHLILHSSKLVLVDRAGEVRGWFDPLTDPADRDALLEAARQTLAEAR
jgi:protein SCO1/2